MKKPLVLIPQYFGSLVFDRRSARYLPFDAECTRLLRRAARQPLQDPGLRGFLQRFQEEGFWDLQGYFEAEILEIQPPASHLCGPLAVHLEVSAACNLSCSHCFAGSLPRREAALDRAKLDRLFQEMAGMGCFRLGLTGGEPLLRKDLLDILDSALDRGLCPSLTTNALLLTEEMARELGRRQLVWLNVSLEGATPASNDPVRGRGTWQRVLEKLKILRGHARFSLAFTITSGNAHEVEECVQLAQEVGAAGAVFRPLYPVGSAQKHPELMPSYRQYARAVETLGYSPRSRQVSAAHIYSGAGCGAANLICSVGLGGTVNPCSYLGSEFKAGNLRQRSLSEIWHESQNFHRLRGIQGESFSGGCRARAQSLAGSAQAADPWQQEFLQLGGVAPAANWEV
jgi:radical SAM protein with 4Fe4S-binding SPASM domain